MTKSSAPKATKKTRGAHRKTARKVGAGNAHSNDRKMAPKAVTQKRAQSCRRESAHYISQNRRSIRSTRSDCANAKSRSALSPKRASLRRASFMCTLSKLYWRVGRDLSSRLVRAPWRSIVRRSTLLGAISMTVSVSRKAWPERRALPRRWNCRQRIGASNSASWRPKLERCARYPVR